MTIQLDGFQINVTENDFHLIVYRALKESVFQYGALDELEVFDIQHNTDDGHFMIVFAEKD